MRLIIASRPAKKSILIFCAIALLTGGLCSVAEAVKVIRAGDLDPDPVLSPGVGNETKIYYSIPENAKEQLKPGALVSVIPSGCATKYKKDLTYYDCSDIYFKQYYKGNRLVYMVIEKP